MASRGGVPGPSERLHVIGLVSGGKDSFFSLLHCAAHGHRLVALANLHPRRLPQGPEGASSHPSAAGPEVTVVRPHGPPDPAAHESGPGRAAHRAPLLEEAGSHAGGDDDEEADLNSFMYQTVGHEVLPLYADATGLPLFRRAITGGAVQQGREYAGLVASRPGARGALYGDSPDAGRASGDGDLQGPLPRRVQAQRQDEDEDETESMIPLLRAVLRAYPEANALSAGAILSTYQRTRVEAVAVRLGLVPLAYLWKFPVLPPPAGGAADDAQLLRDLGAAGFEARIVKVASGGLDEGSLWEDVADPAAVERLRRAMRRFGTAELGAVLGEGGEFETLVLDGPSNLFKRRIVVEEGDRRVVREGGGSARLVIRRARAVTKTSVDGVTEEELRIPEVLDERFKAILNRLASEESQGLQSLTLHEDMHPASSHHAPLRSNKELKAASSQLLQRCVVADAICRSSIHDETHSIVSNIRSFLSAHSLPSTSITNTVIVLSRMGYFATVNKIYGPLFPDPNPPARVTFSVGTQALPEGVNIAVFITVVNSNRDNLSLRSGLHVQSRSYWAPANIGPYSQATDIPVSTLFPERSTPAEGDVGPRLVTVAGQIPLVPATMDLPPDASPVAYHIVLALQHLWRIGVEMGVQWWTSAVVYVPRTMPETVDSQPVAIAILAARAWHALHARLGDEDDEADDGGPDLWDRKFDPRYRTFGEERHETTLPDHAILDGDHEAVPYVFLAEVGELPRGAQVEWHAHSGVSHVAPKSVRYISPVRLEGDKVGGVVQHTILLTSHGLVVQSTLAVERSPDTRIELAALPLEKWLGDSLKEAVEWRPNPGGDGPFQLVLAYVEMSDAWPDTERMAVLNTPAIPCFSLYDAQGNRLAAVLIFRTLLQDLHTDEDS